MPKIILRSYQASRPGRRIDRFAIVAMRLREEDEAHRIPTSQLALCSVWRWRAGGGYAPPPEPEKPKGGGLGFPNSISVVRSKRILPPDA
jgi:hypothetical protein